jgi:hypothetical protein
VAASINLQFLVHLRLGLGDRGLDWRRGSDEITVTVEEANAPASCADVYRVIAGYHGLRSRVVDKLVVD